MKIRAASTLWPCLAAAVLMPLLGARSAHASTQYCFNGLTCNSSYNVKTGEDQLKLTVSAFGDKVKMKFSNTGPKPSSITRIYFDDRNSRLGSSTLADSGAGVTFTSMSTQSGLPSGQNATPAFQTTLKFGSTSPTSQNGVGPGEWLELCFSLNSGSLADLLNDIKIKKLRIGLHVQSFKKGGSESFINDPKPCGDQCDGNPIPLPSAAGMGLVAMGLLAGIRRRA